MGPMGLFFSLNISMWLNSLLFELHAIYIYAEFSKPKEGQTLNEVMCLIGLGLIETAYIKYRSIIDQLYAIPSTMHDSIVLIDHLFKTFPKT